MLTASYAAAALAMLCLIAFCVLYLRYGKGWNDHAQRQAEALKTMNRNNDSPAG